MRQAKPTMNGGTPQPTIKKVVVWTLSIVLSTVLLIYAYFATCFNLLSADTIQLMEFRDIKNDATYRVLYSTGDVTDYESIVAQRVLGDRQSVLLGNFERYDRLIGFSVIGADSLQIIVGNIEEPDVADTMRIEAKQ